MHIKINRCVVLIIFAALGVGINGEDYNARLVDIKDYPYVVSVREYDVHICTGAILSKFAILTSQNCVPINNFYSAYSIQYGITRLTRTNRRNVVQVSSIAYNFESGLASLILTQPLILSDVAKPTSGLYLAAKVDWAQVLGWDLLNEEGAASLKMLSLKVRLNKDCQKLINSDEFTSRMMCADNCYCDATMQDEGCLLDLGAPMVQMDISGIDLKAIGTSAERCRQPNFVGQFVSSYVPRDWIKAQSKRFQ